MEDLEGRVHSFEAKTFPEGMRSTQMGTKNITLLQSELLGAIHSIVATDGRIGTRVRNLLSENLSTLEENLAEFKSPASEYFQELADLCKEAQQRIQSLR